MTNATADICAKLDELGDDDLRVVAEQAMARLRERARVGEEDEETPTPDTDDAPYAAKTPRQSDR